jgi:uncharacterized membrane protein YvbJ
MFNDNKTCIKHFHCPCGKDEHYEDATYCTICGRKIGEAAVTASPEENKERNHL